MEWGGPSTVSYAEEDACVIWGGECLLLRHYGADFSEHERHVSYEEEDACVIWGGGCMCHMRRRHYGADLSELSKTLQKKRGATLPRLVCLSFLSSTRIYSFLPPSSWACVHLFEKKKETRFFLRHHERASAYLKKKKETLFFLRHHERASAYLETQTCYLVLL